MAAPVAELVRLVRQGAGGGHELVDRGRDGHVVLGQEILQVAQSESDRDRIEAVELAVHGEPVADAGADLVEEAAGRGHVVEWLEHARLDDARRQLGGERDQVGLDLAGARLHHQAVVEIVEWRAGFVDADVVLRIVEFLDHRPPRILAAGLVPEPGEQVDLDRLTARLRGGRARGGDRRRGGGQADQRRGQGRGCRQRFEEHSTRQGMRHRAAPPLIFSFIPPPSGRAVAPRRLVRGAAHCQQPVGSSRALCRDAGSLSTIMAVGFLDIHRRAGFLRPRFADTCCPIRMGV